MLKQLTSVGRTGTQRSLRSSVCRLQIGNLEDSYSLHGSVRNIVLNNFSKNNVVAKVYRTHPLPSSISSHKNNDNQAKM
jgi:hypothetical protein